MIAVVAGTHDQFLAFLAVRRLGRADAAEVVHAGQLRGFGRGDVALAGGHRDRSDWPLVGRFLAGTWTPPDLPRAPATAPDPVPTSESGQLSLF